MTTTCKVCSAAIDENSPGAKYWAQGKWGGMFDSKIYADTVEYYCGDVKKHGRSSKEAR